MASQTPCAAGSGCGATASGQLGLGWITDAQHERANDLGWGSAGGWAFRHHHSHMSFVRP